MSLIVWGSTQNENEGQGNLDEMEKKELDGLMSAYQGMEASKKEEDLKPLLVAASIGVCGLLFGA